MQTLAEAVCPDRVGRLVRRLAKEEDIHMRVAYYALALRAFHRVPCRSIVLCDTVEVFSTDYHDSAGKPTDRVLSFVPSEEREMLLASGHMMAIQQAEADYLARLVPERPVLTAGMDCDVPSHPGLPSDAAEVIGVVGSANQANVDGLRVFLDRSWPLIRAHVPGARLRIAGGPGAAARGMHGSTASAGVEMTGWIADIADFYRGVRFVVNPVQIGTGLKIKTVEALGHCRPVVTYAIGCEGVEPGAEEALCVVDEASAMAEACATLLLDPARCDRMALAAGRFAAAALSADIVYAPLRGLLETIGGGRG